MCRVVLYSIGEDSKTQQIVLYMNCFVVPACKIIELASETMGIIVVAKPLPNSAQSILFVDNKLKIVGDGKEHSISDCDLGNDCHLLVM